MFIGTLGLVVGVGLTLLAVALTSEVAFFIGTAVGGVGFGAGFQGAVRTVLPLAAPHERSGVLSTMWVVSYLALGLPAIVAGFLVVHGGGFLNTTWQDGVAVIMLAVLALAGLAWSGSTPARRAARHGSISCRWCHTVADGLDPAGDLMARSHREGGAGYETGRDHGIGMADAAGLDGDADLARSGVRNFLSGQG
jgi:MFS family permease